MSFPAAKFGEKVLQKLPRYRKDSESNTDDPELIETLANLFSSFDGTRNIEHEQYGKLIFDESEHDMHSHRETHVDR